MEFEPPDNDKRTRSHRSVRGKGSGEREQEDGNRQENVILCRQR